MAERLLGLRCHRGRLRGPGGAGAGGAERQGVITEEGRHPSPRRWGRAAGRGKTNKEEMMNTYKTILHTIIEPIVGHDEEQLATIVTRLKQTDGESWAVGEMLERALKYIETTAALIDEVGKMQCYVVESNGHYSIECTA